MFKKIILLLISLFILSCTSPYGSSGGTKFKSRKGIYQNEAQNVAVEITDKDSDNLTVTVLGNTDINETLTNINETLTNINETLTNINETLTVNSESSGTYMTIKSVIYTGYVYNMNFGNSVNTIFITVKDGQNNNIVYNQKLLKQ